MPIIAYLSNDEMRTLRIILSDKVQKLTAGLINGSHDACSAESI